MNIIECIESRRSVRKYSDKKVESDVIKELLRLGTMAPTSLGKEPWGFVVIQDKEEINEWSEKTKEFLLKNLDKFPFLSKMEGVLKKPDFSLFNHAENVIAVYGDTESHSYVEDCTLATENIVLAANSMDIGTCWIGFAQFLFNDEEFKTRYNVPENYKLVSTLTLGYMIERPSKPKRKEAIIFNETK